MKRITISISTIILVATSVIGQTANNNSTLHINNENQATSCFVESVLNTGFGFGFQLNQIQSEYGIGLNLTSPLFFYDKMAFRLKGNFMLNEHFQGTTSTLTPYSNISLGMVGFGGKIGDYIRLYGEGGVLLVLPNDQFSSEQFVLGGYGLIGFEFFVSEFNNYFIEIGHVGSGAKEDKIPAQSHYSNGMLISTGLRFYIR